VRPALVFLEGPVQVGTTWRDEEGRYKVTAVAQTVTVPARTFTNCIEVTNRRRGGKATVVTLYASQVGVVQREEIFPIIEGVGSFHPQR
jgi:heme A synthase